VAILDLSIGEMNDIVCFCGYVAKVGILEEGLVGG
jgi:hypothetical protein